MVDYADITKALEKMVQEHAQVQTAQFEKANAEKNAAVRGKNDAVAEKKAAVAEKNAAVTEKKAALHAAAEATRAVAAATKKAQSTAAQNILAAKKQAEAAAAATLAAALEAVKAKSSAALDAAVQAKTVELQDYETALQSKDDKLITLNISIASLAEEKAALAEEKAALVNEKAALLKNEKEIGNRIQTKFDEVFGGDKTANSMLDKLQSIFVEEQNRRSALRTEFVTFETILRDKQAAQLPTLTTVSDFAKLDTNIKKLKYVIFLEKSFFDKCVEWEGRANKLEQDIQQQNETWETYFKEQMQSLTDKTKSILDREEAEFREAAGVPEEDKEEAATPVGGLPTSSANVFELKKSLTSNLQLRF